ncbi:diaminopimelate epimerase [Pseudomonas tohonis]|uniref:diaminopimelate epimerase n=1 Tax=Pseudomonas tohonis TaxID=2725477 RepID=UPI001F2FB1C6|nr:diaminopimelate epimerase [Pseudomonas tohonis]
MSRLYDARGNRYVVTTPEALRRLGIAIAQEAAEAAQARENWSAAAIEALCGWPEGERPEGAKGHRSDGLLVGPFGSASPWDLLIVNTDGSLTERSGNGMTLFAQALLDDGHVAPGQAFVLHVHHDKPGGGSPVVTPIEPAVRDGQPGFWLQMGAPGFGPEAVGADSEHLAPADFHGRPLSRVDALAQLDPGWCRSQFVRIGNPHCVTLLEAPAALPAMPWLRAADAHAALERIAYAAPIGAGDPCPAGVNLQWAARAADGAIEARVFERGEGATESSGSSACAVACAAWKAGLVAAGEVRVRMPGGTAPLRLEQQGDALVGVWLFGVGTRLEG